MAFQQVVNFALGAGLPGELAYDGPVRAFPWQLISTPQLNVVGATAYTVVSGMTDNPTAGAGTVAGVAMAGGLGEFAGILVAPKSYTYAGAIGTPTMTLPDDTIAELLTMGQIFVTLVNGGSVGDLVIYNTTTGALGSTPDQFSVTASFSGTVMTVTGSPNGPIGPNTQIRGAGVVPGTTVVSQGSGTGGAGTYNLSETQPTIASETVTALGSEPPAGYTYVPNAKVILVNAAAGGLAIISLTN